MPGSAEAIPGWFGKIPSLGDFASRRLPQPFIDTWDHWLQHAMTASRAALGSAWLDVYLNSPIWRFLLLPGVVGDPMWAGVMMPSVDKVGRHFPLTIAVRVEPQAGSLAAAVAAQEWYAGLEEAALATLDMAFLVDQFEARLAQLPFPQALAQAQDAQTRDLVSWWRAPGTRFRSAVPAGHTVQHLMLGAATQLLQSMGEGKSLWWHAMAATDVSSLECHSGLPHPDTYASMLHGRDTAQTSQPAPRTHIADVTHPGLL